ncbi:MAG: MlaD family protein [Spirochaetales bacterium]
MVHSNDTIAFGSIIRVRAPGKLAKSLVFIGVCVGLLVVFFVSVVGDQWLHPYDTYYVEFEDQSVEGLEIGAGVQYRGITVGEVRDIYFSDDDNDIIVVEISARSDVPIRSDVTASAEPVGISGITQLSLGGGSQAADYLEPGSSIVADTSFVSTIFGVAESAAGGIDELIGSLNELLSEQNREEFSRLITSLNATIEESRPGIIAAVDSIEASARSAESSLERIDRVSAQVEQEVSGEEVAEVSRSLRASAEGVESIVAQAENTAESVDAVVRRTDDTVRTLDLLVEQNRRTITTSMRSLQRAMSSFSDLTSQVNDDPSLLLRGRSGGSTLR